ncbi:MAG: type II secretion system F family protein [Candidatus Nanopelagicales bacterium]
MISVIFSVIASWLLFTKPLPRVKSKKSALSPNQLCLLLALVIIIFLPNLLGIFLAVCCYFFLPKLLVKLPTRKQQRQQRLIEQELDLAIDLISAALNAGLGVLAALDAVSKVVEPALGAQLAAAANRIQWGADLEKAFDAEFQVIASALARAMDHGVGAGKALAEIAARTRTDRKQELLRRAKKLSVTLALPIALLMLPGFILLGVVPMIVPAISSLW